MTNERTDFSQLVLYEDCRLEYFAGGGLREDPSNRMGKG
jgi:hypothetical protein